MNDEGALRVLAEQAARAFTLAGELGSDFANERANQASFADHAPKFRALWRLLSDLRQTPLITRRDFDATRSALDALIRLVESVRDALKGSDARRCSRLPEIEGRWPGMPARPGARPLAESPHYSNYAKELIAASKHGMTVLEERPARRASYLIERATQAFGSAGTLGNAFLHDVPDPVQFAKHRDEFAELGLVLIELVPEIENPSSDFADVAAALTELVDAFRATWRALPDAERSELRLRHQCFRGLAGPGVRDADATYAEFGPRLNAVGFKGLRVVDGAMSRTATDPFARIDQSSTTPDGSSAGSPSPRVVRRNRESPGCEADATSHSADSREAKTVPSPPADPSNFLPMPLSIRRRDFAIPPLVRQRLERCRDSFRSAADAGEDFTSYRIDVLTDRLPAEFPDFEAIVKRSHASQRLLTFRRDNVHLLKTYERRPRVDDDRLTHLGTTYSHDRLDESARPRVVNAMVESARALSIPLIDDARDGSYLLGWLDFVHGWGWFPPDGLAYVAPRFSACRFDPNDERGWFGAKVRAEAWHDQAFREVFRVEFVEDCGQPAMTVSELTGTLRASALAIDAFLIGALTDAPFASPWTDVRALVAPDGDGWAIADEGWRNDAVQFVRERGVSVAEFERTRAKLIASFCEIDKQDFKKQVSAEERAREREELFERAFRAVRNGHASLIEEERRRIEWNSHIGQMLNGLSGRREAGSERDKSATGATRRRGRPPASRETLLRHRKLCEAWDRARESGIAKAEYARDNGMTLKTFERILAAHRKRKARGERRAD